jgi:hypothetical protein
MIDTLRGIALVIFIAALAGAIAYIGDRVGHEVGRKRLTLFGIRPRYTSTIVAIGTGVLIALAVTLGAIFASNEVKTAFFRLYSINDQIQALQTREQSLENKVNNEMVVIPLNGMIVPGRIAVFPRGSDADLRYKIIHDYYTITVNNANRLYVPPLKEFAAPSNVEQSLRDTANQPEIAQRNAESDLFVVAVASQNLFRGDPIHFTIRFFPDIRFVQASQEVGSIDILAGKDVNFELAVDALQKQVGQALQFQKGFPSYFLGTPWPTQFLPGPNEMNRMLTTGSGVYRMTAYAATDIYTHTAVNTDRIPIFVTLSAVQ